MAQARETAWNTREVTELAAREASYRERLSTQDRLNERLRACSDSLRKLLRDRPVGEANLLETLSSVALLSGPNLQVARASVWTVDDAQDCLRCHAVFVDGIGQPCESLVLPLADCPRYWHALEIEQPVAVTDALSDPRTYELSAYLRKHGIGALMDIAVSAHGNLLGLVCLEHVGGPRSWWSAEVAFAAQLASLVALAVETERRMRAEFAAREAEARYRHLVESLPITVYSAEVSTRQLTYISPQVVELSGVDPHRALRLGFRGWIRRVVAEDRPRVLARFHTNLAKGFSDELVYRVRLAPGAPVRWIRDTCSLVRDASGEPVALQGVLADVTAQREAELAREENDRRVRTLVRNAELVVVVIDPQGRISHVNPHFSEVTKYSRDEAQGTVWFDYLASKEEAERLRASYRSALRIGSIVPRAEYAIRTKTGEIRRFIWTRMVIKDTDGNSESVVTFGMDITDRLRLEAELVQQTKLESLGHLAAAVAHDFNNLLTVILHQTERLASMAPPGVALDRIKNPLDAAIAQATELTLSLLVYARQGPERKEHTDVDALLRELEPLVAAVAGKDLSLITTLHAEGARILIDRTRLRQVVLNLVGNAAQATRGKGSTIRVSTRLAYVDPARAEREQLGTAGGEFVVLSVEDDGRGMDEATVEKIFEPFFTTKGEGQGTGLGLAICQSIVRAAHGFIEVKSKVGEGTRVSIFVTRQVNEPDATRLRLESGTARLPRVLMVLRTTARQNLPAAVRDAGYGVMVAPGAEDALGVLKAMSCDVLVVDAEVGEAAVELARTARLGRPGLRLILLEVPGADPLAVSGALRVPRTLEPAVLVDVIDALQRKG